MHIMHQINDGKMSSYRLVKGNPNADTPPLCSYKMVMCGLHLKQVSRVLESCIMIASTTWCQVTVTSTVYNSTTMLSSLVGKVHFLEDHIYSYP